MRHEAIFQEFIEKYVNLNANRLRILEQRIETVERFLRSSELGSSILAVSTQGSYLHRTIIKPPLTRNSFDADVTVYLKPTDKWAAKDYIDQVYMTLKASSTYRSMASRQTRCVNLNYAGHFHLDIVPMIVQQPWFGRKTYKVCNRLENGFEVTDGPGFDRWWNDQAMKVPGEKLVIVTRILKYLRDVKGTFSCKSILLTTLVGLQIHDDEDANDWKDIATSLQTIVRRLDDFMRGSLSMPSVENPVLAGETFTRHWDQRKYRNFRLKIRQYREWIEDAYAENDPVESVAKWRRVLGPDFASHYSTEELQKTERDADQEDGADKTLSEALSVGALVIGALWLLR